jgi:F-type H+-transporting ATPase subunit delta
MADKNLVHLLSRYMIQLSRDGDLILVRKELHNVAKLMKAEPRLLSVLAHPSIPNIDKLRILSKITDNDLIRNSLNVLLVTKNIRLIHELDKTFSMLVYTEFDIIVAELKTPKPLSAKTERMILEKIIMMTGKETDLRISTDPSLIGGVWLKIKDRVYDCSVRAKLSLFKEQVMNA